MIFILIVKSIFKASFFIFDKLSSFFGYYTDIKFYLLKSEFFKKVNSGL